MLTKTDICVSLKPDKELAKDSQKNMAVCEVEKTARRIRLFNNLRSAYFAIHLSQWKDHHRGSFAPTALCDTLVTEKKRREGKRSGRR
jgi:hypothetical protein